MIEKLMTLLEEAEDLCSITRCEDCAYNGRDCWLRLVASHLIDNGVTFPVRCKDCKHWNPHWMVGENCGRCLAGRPVVTEQDHYCARGVYHATLSQNR